MKQSNNNISRRNFMKLAAFATAGFTFGGCVGEESAEKKAQSGDMTLRKNPNTGDEVSILGFGCMRFPTVGGQSAQKDNSAIDQEEVNRQIDYALAHGVNYYDTSPRYCRGLSETALGIALARHPRDSYFIATKLSNFDEADQTAEASKAMFEKSLQTLKTDYIDYYLLHSVGNGGLSNFKRRYIDNGILDYCVELRRQGKVRNLGFSYHGDINVFKYLLELHDNGEIHWDFAQIQLNYINWEHSAEPNQGVDAEDLYNMLESRGIPIVIMEPLLGGSLAKVPRAVAGKMAQRRQDDTPAAWAFRYAAKPGVLTVLSGMTYMEHIKENIATYSPLEPITGEEDAFLMEMADLITANDTVPCTACAYCMPCPYGIDIPGTFAHYNKCVNDDNVPRDSREPGYDKARRAFLIGYDHSVTPLRQADQCIGCGGCVSACPQSINIPIQLKKIADYTERLRQN